MQLLLLYETHFDERFLKDLTFSKILINRSLVPLGRCLLNDVKILKHASHKVSKTIGTINLLENIGKRLCNHFSEVFPVNTE